MESDWPSHHDACSDRANLVTASVVSLVQRWLGFAPLILFLMPVAMFVRIGGIWLALATAVIAAMVADHLFVEPVRHVTVHGEGFRLLVTFVLATMVAWLAARMMHRHT
jgi:K+-sensing histidine kinase KdpD